MLRRTTGLVALFVLLLGAACGDDDSGDGEVTVFAAASLTESFTELAVAFEESTGTGVTLSFAASSELVTQIAEGAPADVFASADEANMDRLVDAAGTGSEPQVFATNRLEIVVEPGNPLGIASIQDLADPALLFVTAAPEVPIGRYTLEVLEAADVVVTPVSLEESVRGVLGKVRLGEADAGIVYRTDVIAAGDDVSGVEIPLDINVVARYPIAVTAAAPRSDDARAFVDFVLSDQGQAILARYGFGRP